MSYQRITTPGGVHADTKDYATGNSNNLMAHQQRPADWQTLMPINGRTTSATTGVNSAPEASAAAVKVVLDESAAARRRRRQLIVSLLVAEPTLDYLVQNGVIERAEAERIAGLDRAAGRRRQNEHLLRAIETCGDQRQQLTCGTIEAEYSSEDIRTAASDRSTPEVSVRPGGEFRLLMNVLRQTGQHYLANMIDDGQRIIGCRASGYLSRARHRGQVEITIRVQSILLKKSEWPLLVGMTSRQETAIVNDDMTPSAAGHFWLGLGDIQSAIFAMRRRLRLTFANNEDESDSAVVRVRRHRSKGSPLPPSAPPPSPMSEKQPPRSTVGVSAPVKRKSNKVFLTLCCCCCKCCYSNDDPVRNRSQVQRKAASSAPVLDDIMVLDDKACRQLINSWAKNYDGKAGVDSKTQQTLEHNGENVVIPTKSPEHTSSIRCPRRTLDADLNQLTELELNQSDAATVSELRKCMNYIRLVSEEFYETIVADEEDHVESGQIISFRHQLEVGREREKLKNNNARRRKTDLEMYFEQRRGVLVLAIETISAIDANPSDYETTLSDSGLTVTCICTRQDHIDRLKQDLESGRLTKQIAEILDCDVTDDSITSAINGKQPNHDTVDETSSRVQLRYRIDVYVDPDELETARAELTMS